MVNLDTVYKLMRDRNLPCVKVSDWSGNKLLEFTDLENTPATIEKLEAFEDIIRSYGRVKMRLANPVQCKGNWSGCIELEVVGTAAAPGQQQQQQQQQLSGLNSNYAIPSGYVPLGVMEAKIESLQKDIEWNNKLSALEAKISGANDSKMIPDNAWPYIFAMLAPDNAQVQKLAGLNTATAPGAATGEVNATPEQIQQLEILISSICSKVGTEKVLLLLKAVDKKPSLVDMAISFVNS